MRQPGPGTGERGVTGNEEGGGKQVGLGLHLRVPDPAAAWSDGRSWRVLQQQVRQLVGDGVGQAAAGVHRVEDDQPAGAGDDRSGGEGARVDDGELPDRGRAGALGGQVGDGRDRDAVLAGQAARIEAVV